jgi:hypothetical protein
MKYTLTEAEILAARLGVALPGSKPEAPKQTKYRNTPMHYDGQRYASKAEALRAQELDMLIKTGDVRFWIGQPIALRYSGIRYRPDFLVISREGDVWCEDVKGAETERFRLIRRLWNSHGPCDLRILRWKLGTWVIETVKGRTR